MLDDIFLYISQVLSIIRSLLDNILTWHCGNTDINIPLYVLKPKLLSLRNLWNKRAIELDRKDHILRQDSATSCCKAGEQLDTVHRPRAAVFWTETSKEGKHDCLHEPCIGWCWLGQSSGIAHPVISNCYLWSGWGHKQDTCCLELNDGTSCFNT